MATWTNPYSSQWYRRSLWITIDCLYTDQWRLQLIGPSLAPNCHHQYDPSAVETGYTWLHGYTELYLLPSWDCRMSITYLVHVGFPASKWPLIALTAGYSSCLVPSLYMFARMVPPNCLKISPLKHTVSKLVPLSCEKLWDTVRLFFESVGFANAWWPSLLLRHLRNPKRSTSAPGRAALVPTLWQRRRRCQYHLGTHAVWRHHAQQTVTWTQRSTETCGKDWKPAEKHDDYEGWWVLLKLKNSW